MRLVRLMCRPPALTGTNFTCLRASCPDSVYLFISSLTHTHTHTHTHTRTGTNFAYPFPCSFRDAASQLIDEWSTPQEALARALAKITGYKEMRARSLLVRQRGPSSSNVPHMLLLCSFFHRIVFSCYMCV